MAITVSDARGERVSLARPAQRVVSLVPSETETVVLLGCSERLVGRTDYCVEPVGQVEHIATVGGTKDADVHRILALAPDLVLMNQEENTLATYIALVREVPVHLSFPKTVGDALGLVRDVAVLLGLDPATDPVVAMMALDVAAAEARRGSTVPVRVFCPIWRDPWMTVRGDTFISDVLDLAGGANVFADRTRRYPLAADLGRRAPWDADRVGDRDLRYPRVTLDEIVARAPDVILLPDEPHPFCEADADVLRALDIPAARLGRVHLFPGRFVSWYTPRITEGVRRVAAILARR